MSASQALAIPDETLILCYYLNATQKIQILRVHNEDQCNLEQIVFPQQRFLFQAAPQAQLAVYVEQEGKPILQKISLCQNCQASAAI